MGADNPGWVPPEADAVRALQNAGKLSDCGVPAREQIIDLAGAEDAGAASQIPAGGNPEVYDEGFWFRVNAWAGQFGLTGPAGIVRASGVPGAG